MVVKVGWVILIMDHVSGLRDSVVLVVVMVGCFRFETFEKLCRFMLYYCKCPTWLWTNDHGLFVSSGGSQQYKY